MRAAVSIAVFVGSIGLIVCPPLNKPEAESEKEQTDPLSLINLAYGAYVQQVANILEKDEDFKKKLQEANATDLEGGTVAKYLAYAGEKTRDALHEAKKAEIRRLRELHLQLIKNDQEAGRPFSMPNVDMEHIDHANSNSFEIEDLKKLIKKTTDDLTQLDVKRREEFKRYEMEKEIEYRDELKHAANETIRGEIERQHNEAEARHKNHTNVHHPGSKDQLEEVWQDVDHMDSEFNPKTFFMMHDLNGDGYLSFDELEALFQKELDKVYDPNNPDDDQVEREAEMNNMREHVMKEMDTDHDGYVSIDEFLKNTQGKEFEEDKGWQTLDQQPDPYTEEELKEFEAAMHEQEERFRRKHENVTA